MSQRILLVEDEENLRSTIRLNLELEGYDVTEARDGKTGLDTFRSAHFDLIILDVMLPEMDGYTLCRKIRMENTEVPLLFLTAKGSSDERVQGLKLGADDYLAKPFNLLELLLRVSNLLRRKSKNPESRIQNQLYRFGGNEINFATYQIKSYRGEKQTISKREIHLLKLLIEKKNEVVSREDILKNVWEYDVYPSTRTIEIGRASCRERV